MLIEKRDEDIGFIIPISIPKSLVSGIIRAKVFVDPTPKNIPYEEENDSFNLSAGKRKLIIDRKCYVWKS